jgi:hypothetical protein
VTPVRGLKPVKCSYLPTHVVRREEMLVVVVRTRSMAPGVAEFGHHRQELDEGRGAVAEKFRGSALRH